MLLGAITGLRLGYEKNVENSSILLTINELTFFVSFVAEMSAFGSYGNLL